MPRNPWGLVVSSVVLVSACAPAAHGITLFHPQATAHFLRARILTFQEKYAEALKEYEAAVRYDPRSSPLRVSLARAYLRQEKYGDATRVCREAIALAP